MKIPLKLFYQYMAIFVNFSPTSSNLHPLQVENCGSNSRLVVDEMTVVNSGSKGLKQHWINVSWFLGRFIWHCPICIIKYFGLCGTPMTAHRGTKLVLYWKCEIQMFSVGGLLCFVYTYQLSVQCIMYISCLSSGIIHVCQSILVFK